MENTLTNAFFLLAVGMITVFIILVLVIICGLLLRDIVNKYFPEEKEFNSAIPEEKAKHVIEQIVKKVTNSKGVVEKIEKL